MIEKNYIYFVQFDCFHASENYPFPVISVICLEARDRSLIRASRLINMLLIRKAEGKEVHPWELQLKLLCCQRGRKKQTQSSSLKFIWALQPPWITPAITFYLLSCIKRYLDKWLLVHEKDRYVRPRSIWFSNTLLSVWRVKSTNVWTLLEEKVQCLLLHILIKETFLCTTVW